ncbi:MAG: hypothetical protein LBU28_08550, partial [Spirochaetaceae bacterium]|nr:hypothetical protein [Spirochaetaceae bacterium]
LSTIKTLVVEGILDAPSIGGADAVAVTVSAGASLTVKEPIKFNETESKIAAGAAFDGVAAEGKSIPADAGAMVNGAEVKKDEKPIIVYTGALTSAITVEAGQTVQIKGETSTTSVVTVKEGGTLVILNGAILSATGSPVPYAADNGKIIVEGTGRATGLPQLSADTERITDANP